MEKDVEKRMAEMIWLNYFNRYLFENGVISEKEYKQMIERIATRNAKTQSDRAKMSNNSLLQ